VNEPRKRENGAEAGWEGVGTVGKRAGETGRGNVDSTPNYEAKCAGAYQSTNFCRRSNSQKQLRQNRNRFWIGPTRPAESVFSRP
jgi:hypothetical protein